jgi:general secretion pathway protein D
MKRVRSAGFAAATLFALSGCDSPTIQEVLAPLTGGPPSSEQAAPRTNGPVSTERPPSPPVEVAPGANIGVKPPAMGAPSGGDVTLNFVDTDIREIARTVLGTMLKVTYTIDPGVHGTGTIQTPLPIPRSKVLAILESLLAQNGASLTQADGIYHVSASPAGTLPPNLVGGNGAGAGAQIVQLRYASAADLANVLDPFVAPGGKIVADPGRNALLVSGDEAARNSIIGVIRAFDIDILSGQSFAMFPVTGSAQPEKVATELEKVLQSGENGALAGLVKVIPMDRVNAVLVVSSQPRYIEAARRLYRLVDQVSSTTVRTWHVYYVKNGQSTDLEYVLQRAFTPDHVTSTGQSDTNRLGATVPGLQISQQNNGGGGAGGGIGGVGGGGTTGGATGGMTLGSQQQQQGQGQGNQPHPAGGAQAPPSTESLSASGEEGEKTKDRIEIIANRTNNAILIHATPQEYGTIEAMIDKLDILPLQVRIDAVIAEVTLNDQLQYGVQFYLHSGGLASILSQNGASSTGNGLPISGEFPGLVISKVSSAVQFTLSALQAVTDVRVLSSPEVTVLDNEAATLQVGDQVPYLTQSAAVLGSVGINSNTAGTTVVNSVAYQETGVILQVIPRVNSGGLVTLDIAQEVSQPITTTTSNIGSPTFSDRVIKSRVVVQDGQTIGLAGLISDNYSRASGGVPILKDVPLLGTLLSNQDNQRNRTELLVLITPHVDNNQRDTRALTDDLRGKLWRAGLVPQELLNLPKSGSSDPNNYPPIGAPGPGPTPLP